jgi:methionyl aminopeptidase
LNYKQVTEDSLYIGIEACGPGRPFRNIGTRIFEHAQKHGFDVVPVFVGHGIGKYFHGPPDIYHIPTKYPGIKMLSF